MNRQIKIDFSNIKTVLPDEKKAPPISFRVGEKFKSELEAIRKAKGLGSLSDLVAEYVINGYIEDYKTVLLSQARSDKPLSELLRIG